MMNEGRINDTPYKMNLTMAEGAALSSRLTKVVTDRNLNQPLVAAWLHLSTSGLLRYLMGTPVKRAYFANRINSFVNQPEDFYEQFKKHVIMRDQKRNSLALAREAQQQNYLSDEQGITLVIKLNRLIDAKGLVLSRVAQELPVSNATIHRIRAGEPIKRKAIADSIETFLAQPDAFFERFKKENALPKERFRRVSTELISIDAEISRVLKKTAAIQATYKLTDSDVTNAAGLSNSCLSTWRLGKFTPRLKSLAALEDFCNRPAQELMKVSKYKIAAPINEAPTEEIYKEKAGYGEIPYLQEINYVIIIGLFAFAGYLLGANHVFQ